MVGFLVNGCYLILERNTSYMEVTPLETSVWINQEVSGLVSDVTGTSFLYTV